MRRILWAAVALCVIAHAARAQPHGAGSLPVYVSPSADTIYASWSTGSASSTTLTCGTTPGSFDIPATDAGSQTSVTAHSGIVSNLTPGTRYYCEALSGASVTAYFAAWTQQAPTSTAISNVTFGSATLPIDGQNTGDVYGNCESNDGITYVNTDDSAGWNAGGSKAINSNMMIGKFTSMSPLTGANVNLLANFTSGVGGDAKQYSMFCYDGLLFATYGPLNGLSLPLTASYGTLNVSADHGASWATYPNATAYNINGTLPSPATTTMFGGGIGNIDKFGVSMFVSYGPDNGTTLPTYRVDDADAYAYIVGTDKNYGNGSNLWLARIPLFALTTLDASKIEYFTGGDGNLNTNWSSNLSGAVPILTATGQLGASSIQYVPSMARYVMLTWYYPNSPTVSVSDWTAYEAPHPWGPWTSVGAASWSPQGFYYPVPLQATAINATANGVAMTLLTAGDYSGGGTGPYYQLYTVPMTLH